MRRLILISEKSPIDHKKSTWPKSITLTKIVVGFLLIRASFFFLAKIKIKLRFRDWFLTFAGRIFCNKGTFLIPIGFWRQNQSPLFNIWLYFRKINPTPSRLRFSLGLTFLLFHEFFLTFWGTPLQKDQENRSNSHSLSKSKSTPNSSLKLLCNLFIELYNLL